MAKSPSLRDGVWGETGVFAAGASAPSASLGASIRHRIVIPAYNSAAAVCSSIEYIASGTLQGELIAMGPKSFVTVGALKHRLGRASYVEHHDANANYPKGQS